MQTDALLADFTDPTLARLTGRFASSGQSLRFAWAGSAVTVRFRGTGLSVDLRDAGQNRFYAIVDGQVRTEKLVPGRGVHTVELASQLPDTDHTVTLYRLTEAFVGETELLGFRLPPGARLLPAPAPRERRIEIIGDSISTGYGNEGTDPSCPYAPSTQNHYESYGAIAARALDADLVTLAWSGKGVSTNRGSLSDRTLMPELWLRTLPERNDSAWSFSGPAPQLVVINLGTNDFAPEVQDTEPFAPAYAGLVAKVRRRYPQAYVLLTLGPLLRDGWPPGKDTLTTVRRVLTDLVAQYKAAGDPRVELLEFAPPPEVEGYGCDYHPSLATHRRMAEALTERVRGLLDWP